MNIEDFVTYEQALALKKLGFDFETHEFYRCDDCEHFLLHDAFANNHNECEQLASAPTLAQAQKWLRKTKGIYIEPNFIYTPVFEVMIKSEHYALYKRMEKRFNSSYEEALSAGITECIKILENDKEK